VTTTVTVSTSDHPAAVLAFPLKDREPTQAETYTQLGVVEPHSSQDFHAHSGQDILVLDLDLPAAGEAGVIDAASESEAA